MDAKQLYAEVRRRVPHGWISCRTAAIGMNDKPSLMPNAVVIFADALAGDDTLMGAMVSGFDADGALAALDAALAAKAVRP